MKILLFIASILSLAAQTPPPTGTVTFQEGSAIICVTQLSNSNAACSTSSLSVGSHNITAVYSGDANYAGSTSAVLVQVVKAAIIPTTSTLTSSANPSTSGQSVTLTDIVTHP